MADVDKRALRRRWQATGDQADRAAYESACVRDGSYDHLLEKWQVFCQEVFGREYCLLGLVVPTPRGDINFPLVITEDLARIIAKCRERFKREDGSEGYWQWTPTDLSKIVKSDRTAKDGAYVVLVKNRVEADEDHRNKSANHLRRDGVIGITLEERLTYELYHHWETGEHLDRNRGTLCLGSRSLTSCAPSVRFSGMGVGVGYCGSDSCMLISASVR